MSEAAKPADPERALAELEHFWLRACQEMDLRAAGKPNRLPAAAIEMGEASATAWGWLLPLARAGLHAEAVDLWERGALRVEFAACVRALASIREAHRRDPMLCVGLDAVTGAQQALSGPLAVAVLRSPEPATPADGGA